MGIIGSEMIVLTAYATVKPENIEQALESCRTVREASLVEPGCERYDFFVSPDDHSKLVFVEEWTSREHLATHFEQPAFNNFMESMGPLISDPSEIRIFEANLTQ